MATSQYATGVAKNESTMHSNLHTSTDSLRSQSSRNTSIAIPSTVFLSHVVREPKPILRTAAFVQGPSQIKQVTTLQALLREQSAIEPLRHSVPRLWTLLQTEIARYTPAQPGSSSSLTNFGPIPNPSPSSARLVRAHSSPVHGVHGGQSSPWGFQRRVKILVPSDKHPDYNFVGRLLGPRGSTLKTLAAETKCKITIRGKGSIRKDKEWQVLGKPGYEHVFNDPLHVVIEAFDSLDDISAMRALKRAKDAVQLLLVPVPEGRDALKRHQLRALAVMNGTFRNTSSRSMDSLGAGVPLEASTGSNAFSSFHLLRPPLHPSHISFDGSHELSMNCEQQKPLYIHDQSPHALAPSLSRLLDDDDLEPTYGTLRRHNSQPVGSAVTTSDLLLQHN